MQVDEVNDDTKNWKGDVEVTIQHHGALEKTIRWKQKQEYAFSILILRIEENASRIL